MAVQEALVERLVAEVVVAAELEVLVVLEV